MDELKPYFEIALRILRRALGEVPPNRFFSCETTLEDGMVCLDFRQKDRRIEVGVGEDGMPSIVVTDGAVEPLHRFLLSDPTCFDKVMEAIT